MRVLVTGASSGIGKSMAIYLSKLGYDLILVARSRDKLEELASSLPTDCLVKCVDLSRKEAVDKLIDELKDINVDILINNAGFGIFGEYLSLDDRRIEELINLNIIALEKLTRYYLRIMKERNSGYILNVASSASFMPGGPLMANYYASKAYVRSLSEALNYELEKSNTKVKVSVVCPGPVDTNFNNVAGVHFGVSSLTSDYVAKYSIDQMLKGKTLIIPGFKMKCVKFFERFLSDKLLLKLTYKIQKKKVK